MSRIRNGEAKLMAILKEIGITDTNGKKHIVPAIYANEEKADLFQESITGGDAPLVTDRIRLPMINLHATSIGKTTIEIEGTISALFREDLNQIAEQLFDLEDDNFWFRMGTIKIDYGAEDKKLRVIKGRFKASVFA